MFELPKKGIWDIKRWRGFLKRYGYSRKVMNLLPHAASMDSLLFPPGIPSRLFLEAQIQSGEIKSQNTYYEKLIKKTIGLKGRVRGDNWDKLKNIFQEDYAEFVAHRLSKKESCEALDKRMPLSEFVQFFCDRRDFDKLTQKSVIKSILKYVYGDVEEEYPEFAIECAKYGISRETFDEIVTLLKEMKGWDYLPDVTLDGDALGYPDYLIEKVPFGDPNAFILGKQTACCQSIDGHSRDCVLHGFTSVFGGFYRLKKTDGKVVAQCWAGVTEAGEVCFDSIEHNKGYDKALIMSCFKLLSDEILKANPLITRVVFGGGGNTPRDTRFKLIPKARGEDYPAIIGYEAVGYDSYANRYLLSEQDPIVDKTQLMDNPENHIKILKGTDTYLTPGKETKGLAMSLFYRHHFFKAHPKVFESLSKHPLNPLLEEGYYDKSKRNLIGEHFLSFDILCELFDKKIIEKSNNDARYRVHYVIKNDNDIETFKASLRSLSLKEGESALKLCVSGVHAYAIYLEIHEGSYFCFGFDSEGNSRETEYIDAIKQQYPGLKLSTSSAILQYDYYSCGVFAIKALMYFAKHGKSMREAGYFAKPTLDISDLPPQLLKMGQSLFGKNGEIKNVGERSLDTVVSQKKGQTLKGYLMGHDFIDNGKTYSTSALLKRYRYLESLDKIEKKSRLSRLRAVC